MADKASAKGIDTGGVLGMVKIYFSNINISIIMAVPVISKTIIPQTLTTSNAIFYLLLKSLFVILIKVDKLIIVL